MKKFLVLANKDRDANGTYFERTRIAAEKNDCTVVNYEEGMDYSDCDAAIVLGGDGTFIRAAVTLKELNIPLFGINTGTVGYLTGAENSDLETAVERLAKGDYRIKKRMMLDVTVNGGETVTILNDVVISRSGFSRMIKLLLFINDELIDEVSGDGIIVATPTGSTGYNLSAGGSVCVPEAEVILVTPICAHSMTTRGIISSPTDEIKIMVIDRRNPQIMDIGITTDGNGFASLKTGDTVVIRKSPYTTSLIEISEKSFFDTVKKKLS